MRDIEEKERRRELKKRQKRKAREISEKRRPRNREYTLVSCFFVLIFVSMIGYLIYFNYAKSDDFINSPYNTRQDTFSDRVVRGKIISADGQVLAQTNVYEDGTEERTYPYDRCNSSSGQLWRKFCRVYSTDAGDHSGIVYFERR